MLPKVGLVVLNWNGWRDTLDCLASIRQVCYPAQQLEIIVVDNGSSDESVTQLRRQSGFTLLELPSNRGFAAGNNAGIRHALASGCDAVLLLNSDTFVQPDFLTQMLSVFADQKVGVVSPKICYYDCPERLWYAGGKFRQPRLIGEMIGLGQVDVGQYNQARVVDFAVGCCMLIRREVFERIGYLDERFFFYQEDVDFSYRATCAGFSVWYQPAAVILHRVSHSTREDTPRRTFLYAQSRVVFFAKHIRGIRLWAVIVLEIARLLRTVAGALWRGEADLAQSYVQGLMAGLSQRWVEPANQGGKHRV